ncbi:MAG: hypothetical protein ABJB97_08400 [Acidobacteriota bacterium]
MNRSSLLTNLAALLLIWGGMAIGASAQQTQSVGLSPAYLEADVARGQAYNQEFTIVNKTTTRLRFHCSVSDYWYDEKGGRVEGRPGTLPHTASTWIQFTPSEVVVEPMSSAKVTAVISVPANATGGYYTIPYFQGEQAEEPNNPNSKKLTAEYTVAVRLGGLLMFATTTGSEYDLEVKGGAVHPPTSTSPLELELEVENHGNAHVLLRGTYAFLDAHEHVAGRGQFEEQRYLPGQHRSFKTDWAGDLAPGHYTTVLTFTYPRAGSTPTSFVYEIPFDVSP